MKPPARIALRLVAPRLNVTPSTSVRAIHTTLARNAHVAPLVGTGPPPEAPLTPDDKAASSGAYQRVERRRRQAEILKSAKDIRNGKDPRKIGLKKRFWTDVTIREEEGKQRNSASTRFTFVF